MSDEEEDYAIRIIRRNYNREPIPGELELIHAQAHMIRLMGKEAGNIYSVLTNTAFYGDGICCNTIENLAARSIFTEKAFCKYLQKCEEYASNGKPVVRKIKPPKGFHNCLCYEILDLDSGEYFPTKQKMDV